MKRVILPTVLLSFGIATGAAAQDADMCDTTENVKTALAEDYGEREIIAIRDHSNNDLYRIFAQNLDEGAFSWTLTVTDPEQIDPALETCIVDSGSSWGLKHDAAKPEIRYPQGVLQDIMNSFAATSCVSKEGFLALTTVEAWADERVNFVGNYEDGVGQVIISSNELGEGFVGLISPLPDETSLHPFAMTQDEQYCLMVSGVLEGTDIEALEAEFEQGIGFPEQGI